MGIAEDDKETRQQMLTTYSVEQKLVLINALTKSKS